MLPLHQSRICPQPELHWSCRPAVGLLRGNRYSTKGGAIKKTLWQRLVDSNHLQQFWRLLCCHYTKPIYTTKLYYNSEVCVLTSTLYSETCVGYYIYTIYEDTPVFPAGGRGYLVAGFGSVDTMHTPHAAGDYCHAHGLPVIALQHIATTRYRLHQLVTILQSLVRIITVLRTKAPRCGNKAATAGERFSYYRLYTTTAVRISTASGKIFSVFG